MSTQTPLISLRDISICFDKRRRRQKRKSFWAIQDISLDMYQGETLGIVGHNGAGKSTLLKVIAGLFEPDKGEVICNTNARVGLLALKTGFVQLLTGRQNIILSGMFLGVSKEFIESKVDDIIELSGIGDFIDEPVNSYSTGMAARLGFATAYHCAPDILLIDEMLGVGDKEFKEVSKKLILELIHSDKTVAIVSHNEKFIEETCDRVIKLDHGKMATSN